LFPLAVNVLAKETTPLLLEQSRTQSGQDKHRLPRRHRRPALGGELNLADKILRAPALRAIFWQRLSKTCLLVNLSFVHAPGMNHIAIVTEFKLLCAFLRPS